jgi:hypothetical protein
MTDDPYDPNQDSGGGGGGGQRPGFPGGGGGILAFLPLLLSLFGRGRNRQGGKGGCGGGLILLLIIGAGAYFLLSRGGCNFFGGGSNNSGSNGFSASGYDFNRDTFNKASIYESLDPSDEKNPLPEAVSLLKFAPERGDQGHQGSCVAWSSGCIDYWKRSTVSLMCRVSRLDESISSPRR